MEKGTEKNKIIRIAITGPESTGKSTLAEQLAVHFNTTWVPEFAREYLNAMNRPYTRDDILFIAKSQLQNECKLIRKAKKFLFADTELLVTKIWSEHRFENCHAWILQNMLRYKYDFYLLCNIDLPWEFDPLREHPHLREYFFNKYETEMKTLNFNYEIISGNKENRLKNAVTAIEKFFGKSF